MKSTVWLWIGLFWCLWAGCRSSTARVETDACELVRAGYGPPGREQLRAETVASGLEVPWALAFLPGGDLLVTERPGRVRRVRNNRVLPEPVCTIEAAESGEGGLLGLALHPDFATNRLFFIYATMQTAKGPRNRIERWRLSEDGLSADRDRVILDEIPAARFHDGGRLRFGPDGLLYVGTGDAGEPPLAQDPESPAGKVLRLTADGEVPGDNPFPGRPTFVLGVRNTQGFDWAPDGTFYVTDHGPTGELGRSGHDEVNIASAGTNLGWPTIFGCQSGPGMRPPLLTWSGAVPPGGAAVYRGTAIAGWGGSLLVGTLAPEHLHRVVADPKTGRLGSHEVHLRGTYGRLREVVMAPDGHLYITTSNCDGRGRCPPEKDLILRILPAEGGLQD